MRRESAALISFSLFLVMSPLTGCSRKDLDTQPTGNASRAVDSPSTGDLNPAESPVDIPLDPKEEPLQLDKTSKPGVPTVTRTDIPTEPLEPAPYYLAYIRDDGSYEDLIIANPEGQGKRMINLSDIAPGGSFYIDGLSPDGKYFAYHTGETATEGSDLTLHILDLDDKSERVSIPLQTDDFGIRMLELAERLAENPPESMRNWFTEPDVIRGEGIYAFDTGIRSLDWSHDSKLLAFAAQIHGPTSDVYTFDVSTGDLKQLTSGPTQIQYVDWSPNGEWIAHGSAYRTGMGPYMINNFVSRIGTNAFSLDIGGQFGNEWYGSDLFLVYNGANGPGSFGLQAISMQNKQPSMLWRYPLNGYALDMSAGELFVSTSEYLRMDDEGNLIGYPPGIYLTDFNTGSVELIGDEVLGDNGPYYASIHPWPNADEAGIVSQGGDIYGLEKGGELLLLMNEEPGRPYPSPIGDHIAFYGYEDPDGIRVYDAETGEVVVLPERSASCVSWRPDGEGVIFIADGVLYYNDLSEGVSVVIDDHPRETWGGCGVMWIPGDQ